MTQRLSKILLALEALVLAVPVTVLFLMVAPEMLLQALQFETAWQLALLSFAVIAAALIGGWWLMVEFWRHGPARLKTTSAIPWTLALIGVLSTLAAMVFLATGGSSQWPPEAKRSAWALAWGLPLLVPMGHLFAERILRSAADRQQDT